MKCALEMAIIAEDRNRRVAEETERRKAEEVINTILHTKNSIEFCDNVIALELEKTASTQGYCYTSFILAECSNPYGENYYVTLKDCGTPYADGKHSYCPNDKGSKNGYNLNAIIEYLESHCFKVTTEGAYYYQYGWGRKRGIRLNVSI